MSGSDRTECEPSNDHSRQEEEGGVEDLDSIDANGDYSFPKDGYRVEHCYDPCSGRLRLIAYLMMGGELKFSWTLKTWENATSIERGECMRLYWLFVGVIHFLNSGGPVEELRSQIFDFCIGNDDHTAQTDVVRLIPVDILPPEGMHLLTTELCDLGDNDGEYTRREYVFGNLKTGEAMVWVEDIDIHMTTLHELSLEKIEMEGLDGGEAAEVQPLGDFQTEKEDTDEH